MKPLRIGLLVNGLEASRYDHDLVRWAKEQADIEISHLVIYPRRGGAGFGRALDLLRTQGPYELLSRLLFRLIAAVEALILKRSKVYGDHYRSYDLSEWVGGALTISPIVSKSGLVYRFSAEDMEKVRALGLDLLIRCGAGILRGEILHAARLGIISFHHGDNRVNRGSPPGFWECYHEWPQTGFIIQRLTEELDAGEVLVRGSFGTRYYYSLNQSHLYRKSLVHLKHLLKRIAATGSLPPAEDAPSPYSGVLYRVPGPHQCLAYAFKFVKRLALRSASRMLRLRQRWGISLLPGKWDRSALWRSVEVRNPPGRFWADPFVYSHGGKTYCFVEDFVYQANRAHITALEIAGPKVIEHGIALKEPFHLSFPFLFRYRGELFMCPECFESGQIRIYRCAEFPLKWELACVAMEGVCAVDTVLFEKAGRWWMLTSLDESGTGDPCSELYLFSADSPLGANWTPHPRNPIRIDARGGRNAGLIIDGERIFRLAQRQGFDQYGEGLLVFEIKAISDAAYVEELVSEIDPAFKKGLRGMHHLSCDGKTTVIDHCRLAAVS
jgi:hypothetical protein